MYSINEGRNIWCSKEIGNLIGYDMEDLQNMGANIIQQVAVAEDIPKLVEKIEWIRTQIQDGVTDIQYYRCRHRNGNIVNICAHRVCMERNADGTCAAFVGVATIVPTEQGE